MNGRLPISKIKNIIPKKFARNLVISSIVLTLIIIVVIVSIVAILNLYSYNLPNKILVFWFRNSNSCNLLCSRYFSYTKKAWTVFTVQAHCILFAVLALSLIIKLIQQVHLPGNLVNIHFSDVF